MAINWSSAFGSGKSYGKLGIAVTLNNTQTQTKVTVKLYYRSKFSVSDKSNKFYYDWDQSPGTSIGSKSINHTSNTAWDSDNQTLIGTYTKTFERGTAAKTKYFSVKCSGIEYGGGGGSHKVSITIPARNKYTITFHANGGSGAPAAQSYYYGNNITLSNVIPTRSGYKFLGWSTSSTATAASYKAGQAWSGTIANNTVLYAVWQRMYSVTFHANGGKVNGVSSVTQYAALGTVISTLPTATLEGKKFLGWNNKNDGSGAMYTYIKVPGDMTLYAMYEEVTEEKGNCFVKIGEIYKRGKVHQKTDRYREGTVKVKVGETWK